MKENSINRIAELTANKIAVGISSNLVFLDTVDDYNEYYRINFESDVSDIVFSE